MRTRKFTDLQKLHNPTDINQYIPADVTHLVFVGKLNDLTKEFRTARDDKKQIVSPEWIKMCNEEKRHVEEV